MDEDKDCYVVYRIYSNEERPDTKKNFHIYGWTCTKKVLKAFLKQRSEKKYFVKKMPMEELTNRLHDHDNDVTGRYMIDLLKLKSAQTNEEFHLFMTANEMTQVERDIRKMFNELCDIDRIDPDHIDRYTNMIVNLDEKYGDALFYLGFRPREIDALFADNIYSTSSYPYDGITCEEYYIDDSCSDMHSRLSASQDIADKILYSIESFVKVMRKDL